MNGNSINRDLDTFSRKGYRQKISELYGQLPAVTCSRCGRCCFDSPSCTYVEFLNALDYLLSLNLDRAVIEDLFIRLLKYKMLSLVEITRCCFYGEDSKCLLYPAAPLSCKRWGLQSKSEYLHDLSQDREGAEGFRDFYLEHDIVIPNSVVFRETSFCKKVKTENNQTVSPAFWVKSIDCITNMTVIYGEKNAPNSNICDYMIEMCYSRKELFEDRLDVIKRLQLGDKNAIEKYLERKDVPSELEQLGLFKLSSEASLPMNISQQVLLLEIKNAALKSF